MALLTILRYPDPRLHKVAGPVQVFDEQLRALVRDMAQTMYEAPGVGLAATQVNVHKQVIVIDVSETHDQLLVLINPRILKADGVQVCEEGCLSVPGIYEEVERAEHIVVQAEDENGATFQLEAHELLAVCIQHEMDHLKGKVFVEYLSRLKQTRIKSRMQKEAREEDKKKAA
ncbi:MAG TPA: peptide deformylase [Burkholderiales bacterium]|jgi:peptide deformylase|nr:peptide deformylase [Burkholderiales bacterium]